MILEVNHVRYLRDYILWVKFNDGSHGAVDLADELDGPVFGPLCDKRLFKAVRVDPLLRTVVWPNGADLAPEFLQEKLVPTGRKRSNTAGLARMSKQGREALTALREAVPAATAEHRRAGVPIVVRDEPPTSRKAPMMVREKPPRYGARKRGSKRKA